MLYDSFKSLDSEVEAALFEDEGSIGEIVQDLYEIGCRNIIVTSSENNPQLPETSYTVSITFTQNGATQTLFLRDILSFDGDDNAVVWNEGDFFSKHEEA